MAKAERVVSDFEVIAGRKSERLSGSLDRPAMPRRGSFSLLQLYLRRAHRFSEKDKGFRKGIESDRKPQSTSSFIVSGHMGPANSRAMLGRWPCRVSRRGIHST